MLVDEEAIERFGLDHQQLASRIAEEALDLASGQLTTAEGEWLIRYQGRRNSADEFAALPILTTAQGSPVVLGDIARVSEGFAETDREEFYNGEQGLSVDIYQIGDQTPTSISQAVYGELERLRNNLPNGIRLDVSRDSSEIYEDRLNLLLKNAWMGLALVLILMALFLEARLAFWVTLGIPTAFLGAMLFLPWVGVSLNMMSMFAFIIALGIVVDDAILVGENIYSYREQGYSLRDAAVKGAQIAAHGLPLRFCLTCLRPATPVFTRLFRAYFCYRASGRYPVFIISLVEALFILPAHLAHASKPRKTPAWRNAL